MDEREIRVQKLHELREMGIDPFPPRLSQPRSHTIQEARDQFDALAEAKTTITIVGRILRIRDQGKIIFANLADGRGEIQLYVRKDDLGDEPFAVLKKLIDPGDTIETTGFLFTTHKGEKSLHVSHFALLSKSLRALPAKHEGLQDPELRQRKRYLDLIANRDVEIAIFTARARTISAMRQYLDGHGYLEVETPVLQPLYGGATTRPFTTHHNALDRDLYLRIAPELYLKRLLVGGIERVYEVARNFRNEGIDRAHNPEFTMLEFYEAYADYEVMMTRVEEMVATAAQSVLGKLTVEWQGTMLDFTPPWKRISLHDAIEQYTHIDYDKYPDRESLLAAIKEQGIQVDPQRGRGRLIDELKDEMFRRAGPELLQPIFLHDYPLDLSPLAKRKPGTPDTVERFQAHVAGMQLVTAFSELNDPLDQRARFEDQLKQRELGDEEAQVTDEDYIEALEVGMPPAGGVGIGIDRLVMSFTDQASIREVLLFPTLRTLE
jgi:lysyl-tRNA synthetase, class II